MIDNLGKVKDELRRNLSFAASVSRGWVISAGFDQERNYFSRDNSICSRDTGLPLPAVILPALAALQPVARRLLSHLHGVRPLVSEIRGQPQLQFC